MWVGEQISIKGIGNGVSLIIFLNVISRAPSSVIQTIQTMQGNKFLIPLLVLVAFLGTVTIAGIVLFQLKEKSLFIMLEKDLLQKVEWDKIHIYH